MARSEQTKGKCVFCNQSFSRTGMGRHLKACKMRAEKITECNGKEKSPIPIFHLQIQDAYGGHFWLQLEMSGEEHIFELDNYLRAIWLECCDHLSQLSFEKWGEELDMDMPADELFQPGMELLHAYDFGDTSMTKIKVLAKRTGAVLNRKPIFLMARNDAPEHKCQECGKKASWLCIECLYDHMEATLCDKHAENHPHDEYGEPIEIVNSPRLGMCGYTGPADPPY